MTDREEAFALVTYAGQSVCELKLRLSALRAKLLPSWHLSVETVLWVIELERHIEQVDSIARRLSEKVRLFDD